MASLAKTVIATGVSSGLGFQAMKQLLEQTQPYRIILGARNVQSTQKAYDDLSFDRNGNSLSILPLELNDLKSVKTFATEVQSKLGKHRLDYVLLNAAISDGTKEPGPHGSKWSEALIVNHLSHHYLMHLLRPKLVESKSRLIFVSSGAVRNVPDTSVLDKELLAGSNIDGKVTYCQTKFVALLGAHWWRRQLAGQCRVVAVSPGLIPDTGLGRGSGMTIPNDVPDAKSVAEGGSNILRAMSKDDFPEDPEQIFLTSWGEWWPKDVYGSSLDEDLQNKWCPSKEQIEKEEGLAA